MSLVPSSTEESSSADVSLSEGSYIMDAADVQQELSSRISSVLEHLDSTLDGIHLSDDEDVGEVDGRGSDPESEMNEASVDTSIVDEAENNEKNSESTKNGGELERNSDAIEIEDKERGSQDGEMQDSNLEKADEDQSAICFDEINEFEVEKSYEVAEFDLVNDTITDDCTEIGNDISIDEESLDFASCKHSSVIEVNKLDSDNEAITNDKSDDSKPIISPEKSTEIIDDINITGESRTMNSASEDSDKIRATDNAEENQPVSITVNNCSQHIEFTLEAVETNKEIENYADGDKDSKELEEDQIVNQEKLQETGIHQSTDIKHDQVNRQDIDSVHEMNKVFDSEEDMGLNLSSDDKTDEKDRADILAELKQAVEECIIRREGDSSVVKGASTSSALDKEPEHNMSDQTNNHKTVKDSNKIATDNPSNMNTEDSNKVAVSINKEYVVLKGRSKSGPSSNSSDTEDKLVSEMGTQMDPDELEMLASGGFFSKAEMDKKKDTKDENSTQDNDQTVVSNEDESKPTFVDRVKDKITGIFSQDDKSEGGENPKEKSDIEEEEVPNEGEPETTCTVRRKVHFRSGSREPRVTSAGIKSESEEEYFSVSTEDQDDDETFFKGNEGKVEENEVQVEDVKEDSVLVAEEQEQRLASDDEQVQDEASFSEAQEGDDTLCSEVDENQAVESEEENEEPCEGVDKEEQTNLKSSEDDSFVEAVKVEAVAVNNESTAASQIKVEENVDVTPINEIKCEHVESNFFAASVSESNDEELCIVESTNDGQENIPVETKGDVTQLYDSKRKLSLSVDGEELRALAATPYNHNPLQNTKKHEDDTKQNALMENATVDFKQTGDDEEITDMKTTPSDVADSLFEAKNKEDNQVKEELLVDAAEIISLTFTPYINQVQKENETNLADKIHQETINTSQMMCKPADVECSQREKVEETSETPDLKDTIDHILQISSEELDRKPSLKRERVDKPVIDMKIHHNPQKIVLVCITPDFDDDHPVKSEIADLVEDFTVEETQSMPVYDTLCSTPKPVVDVEELQHSITEEAICDEIKEDSVQHIELQEDEVIAHLQGKPADEEIEPEKAEHTTDSKEKGFFKQVKQKLMRHFSKTDLVEDESDKKEGKRKTSTGSIPTEFRDTLCHSDGSELSDDSETCGIWHARGLLDEPEGMETLSDLDLEENMTYPEDLASAIDNYRRNDKTRLSRVKISRYNASFDMYLPDEYKVSAATFKRHIEKTDMVADQKSMLRRGSKATPESPVPYQRGDRISQLIDIYKYTMGDSYGKNTPEEEEADGDKRDHDGPYRADTESIGDSHSEKLDSVSMRSENSQCRKSLREKILAKQALSRDSFADSHPGSMPSHGSSIRSDLPSLDYSKASSADERKHSVTSEKSNESDQEKIRSEEVVENVLTSSKSCEELDKTGRGSRMNSLRRRLSRRLSRTFSQDDMSKKHDTDDESPRKKGWFSSLSRNKGNKIRKSVSMSVLNKDDTTGSLTKAKNKDKKKKEKKDYDTDTDVEGTMKKSKSVLSLNRFKNKEKKQKKNKSKHAIESDTDNESVVTKSKPKKKDRKRHDSGTENEPKTPTKSRWGWRRHKKGDETDTDNDEKKSKSKKPKKEKKKRKEKEAPKSALTIAAEQLVEEMKAKENTTPKSDQEHVSQGAMSDIEDLYSKVDDALVQNASNRESVASSKPKSEKDEEITNETISSPVHSEPNEKLVGKLAVMQQELEALKRTPLLKSSAPMTEDSSLDSDDNEISRDKKWASDTEAGKRSSKMRGTDTDLSDAESFSARRNDNKKFATMSRLKNKKSKKLDTDDEVDIAKHDKKPPKKTKNKKEKKTKEKEKTKEKANKGLKKAASKSNVNDIEVNPKFSLEKVVRSITICSADILFLIGREKDPSKSEVARLIQQSLEQDKRRADAKARLEEQRRMDEERLNESHDSVHDESLEHELEHSENQRNASQPPPLPVSPPPGSTGSHDEFNDSATSPNNSFNFDRQEAQREAEELMLENDHVTDYESSSRLVQEEFELPESAPGSELVSPDELDPQQLYIKLKEAQYKNAVAEAELAKVKTKLAEVENDVIQQQKPVDDEALILLEKTEAQKKHYEKKCEEMALRLRDSEKTLASLQADMNKYHRENGGQTDENGDLLEGSQGQYIELEQNMKTEFGTLEKKYAKAKKLIKEYQTREKEIMQERETYVLQQSEKDQQYNDIVRKLKDKIFNLERSLDERSKAAGLPTQSRSSSRDSEIILPEVTVPVQKKMKPLEMDDISMISDLDQEERRGASYIDHNRDDVSIDSVPGTPLLDNSANRNKAQLASSGAMATRRPPTRRISQSEQVSQDNEDDDSFAAGSDSTVKRSSKRKKPENNPDSKELASLARTPDDENEDSQSKLSTKQSAPVPATRKTISREASSSSQKQANVITKPNQSQPAHNQTAIKVDPVELKSLAKTSPNSPSAISKQDKITKSTSSLDQSARVKQTVSKNRPPSYAESDTYHPKSGPNSAGNKQNMDFHVTEVKGVIAAEKQKGSSKSPVKSTKNKQSRDDLSDTSSIASQQSGSYDPNKADIASGLGAGTGAQQRSELIPMAVDETDDGGIQLISAKTKPGSATKLLSASPSVKSGASQSSLSSSIARGGGSIGGGSIGGGSSSGGGGGGITLVAMRTLDNEYGPSSVERNNGSLPQASTMSLDTGIRRGLTHSRESSTGTNSSAGDLADSSHKSQSYDFTTAKLTTDSPQGDSPAKVSAGKKAQSMSSLNQYQSTPVQEWSPHQVCHWLLALNLDQYAEQFMAKQVDGPQLLAIDNTKIKQLGITNTKDRDLLKKRVKELKSAVERERKQREKEQKAREKLEKQAAKQKKKK